MSKSKQQQQLQQRNVKISRQVTSNRHLTLNSNVAPVATKMRTLLRYSDNFAVSGLPLVDTVFNLNSCYDPNRTAAGHQPLGFDQLSALYARYRVYHTEIRASLHSSSTADPVQLLIVPTNNTTAFTSGVNAAEQPFAQISKLTNVYTGPSMVDTTVDLSVLNGLSSAQYAANEDTQAAITADPNEALCAHVVAYTLSGSNITGYVIVNMLFDVEFFDPFVLAAS